MSVVERCSKKVFENYGHLSFQGQIEMIIMPH